MKMWFQKLSMMASMVLKVTEYLYFKVSEIDITYVVDY